MSRWRVLVIAEAANPEWVSVPLVGWSLTSALRQVASVHLVTQVRNHDAIVRAGLVPGRDFTVIDNEALARPLYQLANRLRGGDGGGWTTLQALALPSYWYFEELVWRRFQAALTGGAFDLVHRVTPLSPSVPSVIAGRLKRAGVPFVLGPLNGGVPWPAQFRAAQRAEREWLSYLHGAHRLIPGYRSTRANAAALIAGSRITRDNFGANNLDRTVYVPENAIDPARFPFSERTAPSLPVRIGFIGRLVPLKGVDMLLDAAAELVRSGKAVIEIIGDGPERVALEQQMARLGIGAGVTMHGWVEHQKIAALLSRWDVLGFPSIREFGGGVVLEAFACGTPAVVVAYGGPGELVTPATGIAVPLGTRAEVVEGFRRAFTELVGDPNRLVAMSAAALERVRRYYTWARKAEQMTAIYDWVMGVAPKPDFGMPFPDRP